MRVVELFFMGRYVPITALQTKCCKVIKPTNALFISESYSIGWTSCFFFQNILCWLSSLLFSAKTTTFQAWLKVAPGWNISGSVSDFLRRSAGQLPYSYLNFFLTLQAQGKRALGGEYCGCVEVMRNLVLKINFSA